MSGLDAAEAVGRSLAAMAEDPRALDALRAEVVSLRAEVAALRGALPPALLSPEQAAQHLGLSCSTIRRRIKDGSLPCRRVGRRILVDLGALRPAPEAEVVRLAHEARRGH